MTRTPFLLRAAALTTLTLLTACNGTPDDGGEPIKGARTPSPSTNSAPDRPVVDLPRGARNVFEGQHTGDPRKDAVLADNARRINSIDDAILRRTVNTHALAYYSSGTALKSATKFVQAWIKGGDTWVGTARYFKRTVTLLPHGAAVVIYCSDESKAFIKDVKTGKVDHDAADKDAYVLYNTRLARSDQGVWRTVSVVSKRGVSQCQP